MKRLILLLILMSLWITETVAQGPPTNFTATAGDRQITLKWTHPSDINTSDITEYWIEVNRDPGTPTAWRLLPKNFPEAFTENPSWTRIRLTNGVKYTLRMRANSGTYSTSVSATPNMPAPTGFTATLDAPTTGSRTVTLRWEEIPELSSEYNIGDRVVDFYEYSDDGGTTWKNAGSRLHSVTGLENGISYAFRVRGRRGSEAPGLPSQTVTVRPLIDAPGTPGTLNVERVEDTAILTWNPPSDAEEDILRYEYSDDGGSTWNPTGSTDTTYTVTGLEPGKTYTFLVRAVYVRADGNPDYIYISRPSHYSNAAVLTLPKPKRRIIQDCPVGWVRSDGFAGRNRRVLLYEVNLEMDMSNLVSIYKPVWVAIYVHPDEGLENLQGWKLQVALPYNHHREYPLTAENSIVMDSKIEGVAGGFAFIENPIEDPFPMVGIGFTGAPAPGFDYRLYDETGKRVDFGISCYKRGDIFQVLKNMEDPRVLRNVLLESFDWDSHYLRSEWTVPVPVNAPGAPSLQGVNLVGTWADLKKQ